MVSVPIHRDTSSVPPMTAPVIDLTKSQSDSPLPTSTTTTSTITTTTNLPPLPFQSTTDPILVRRIGELEQHIADLIQNNLALEERDLPTIDMKEILQQRMLEDNSYKTYEVHNDLYEALQKSLETPPGSLPSQPPPSPPPAGAFGALSTSGASGSSQLPPPLSPPPSTGTAQQQGNKAPSSSKTVASASQSMAWTTSDTRFESIDFLAAQELSPIGSLMQDDSIPDKQSNPEGDQVRVDVNQPLPLGGPLGHVTIQPQFFFNKDLEYLRYGSKGSNPALSISKMKAASYPNFGLELLVPEQMWIDDVCTYDISAKYGISYWWFNRQKFYIDSHDSSSHHKDVKTHMRILSVVRIKAYSRHGYDYLSEIILRRSDFQEHTIAKIDFKKLYPSDFKDLSLLLLQGHLDYLPGSNKRMLSTAIKLWTRNLVIRQRIEDFQLGIESYQTQLNLTKLGWDAIAYEFKHDYTINYSPRAFSDGTLTRIIEALDYRVKEFKINRLNPSINTYFWTVKDVTRSNEFIAAIERRLKTRMIYQNLECFVGGRVHDIDYRLLQRTE
ncbi:hypothetical protein Tco_1055289 [Tanacetum coccineum]|uniref:Reverse transcriptase Ty1/copia-type domain-containing protein n=1 Tax=Tanacetum coccineum TaxID=301880 RepID=A0ABQ5H196_9ASTR